MDFELRQEIEEFIDRTKKRTKMTKPEIMKQLGLGRTQQMLFRKPKKQPSLGLVRSNSITPAEKRAAIKYAEGHRGIWHVKLSYMMLDAGVAYIKPTMLYLILKYAGFYDNKVKSTAMKEYWNKPKVIHEMWHTDITYVKILGVFYFLIVVLDGY